MFISWVYPLCYAFCADADRETSRQVHLSYVSFSGITVGQAHLLDDVIDALELELEAAQSGGPAPLQSWFERKTFTYSLGVEHPLYALLQGAASAPADGKLAQ